VRVGKKLGKMEQLLGVPPMKAKIHLPLTPDGKCDECEKVGYYGASLTVRCRVCHVPFCNLECSNSHMCPGAAAPEQALGVPMMKSAPTMIRGTPVSSLEERKPVTRHAPKLEVAKAPELRGKSLGGDMERLLGVPSMKSGMIPRGSCASCNKKGEYGSDLSVTCSKCRAVFCQLECSGKHQCSGPKEVLRLPSPNLAPPGGRRNSRGESLGGDMERLLGVPSMKSRRMPSGSCSTCQKSGEHGRALTVRCSSCKDIFCDTECSGKHECPKAGGFLGIFKKRSPSPVRHSNSNSNNSLSK
jgi:hypothetical protein